MIDTLHLTLTPEATARQQELGDLLLQFHTAGDRGVDLADRIDALRRAVYADLVIAAIAAIDQDGVTTMAYVQSFTVAESGEPIGHYRWDDHQYVAVGTDDLAADPGQTLRYDETTPEPEATALIDMERVVRILGRAYGIHAFVEQTGGGTATIFAGQISENDEGGDRWDAAAGPGWFAGPGWANPKGALADFYVGPDDHGESDPWTAGTDDNELTIAERIAKVVHGEDYL